MPVARERGAARAAVGRGSDGPGSASAAAPTVEPSEPPGWLSEEQLAAIPLDEIVASRELSQIGAAEGPARDDETGTAAGGDDYSSDGLLSEQALAEMPLDDIVASHRAGGGAR